MASLSNGTSLLSMDIPYVWIREMENEFKLYDTNFPRLDCDYSPRSPSYDH